MNRNRASSYRTGRAVAVVAVPTDCSPPCTRNDMGPSLCSIDGEMAREEGVGCVQGETIAVVSADLESVATHDGTSEQRSNGAGRSITARKRPIDGTVQCPCRPILKYDTHGVVVSFERNCVHRDAAAPNAQNTSCEGLSATQNKSRAQERLRIILLPFPDTHRSCLSFFLPTFLGSKLTQG